MREVMMKAQELAQAILETGYYQKMQELEAQLSADETAAGLDVTLEEVLEGTIEKLRKRYPEGFDKEHSLHRDAE